MKILEQKIDAVFDVVRQHTTCPPHFLRGPSQLQSICRNRALAAGLMSRELDMGVEEIARVLNRKSHSTVVDLLSRCNTELGFAEELQLLTERLRERLDPADFATP